MPERPSDEQTVLIADDDDDDVVALKRVFAKAKVRNPLQVVSTGAQVLAYLAGDELFGDRSRYPYPGLLLLDLKMPCASGFDVLTWIRERREHDALRVVVLTGAGNTRDIRMAYQLGADSFLTKPLSFEDFENLLHTLKGVSIESAPNGKLVTFTPYPPPAAARSESRSIGGIKKANRDCRNSIQ